jgi:condensin complex subunit 2
MSKRTRNRRLSGKVPTDNMDMIENASFDDQENASFGVNNDEEELRKRRRSMKRNKRRSKRFSLGGNGIRKNKAGEEPSILTESELTSMYKTTIAMSTQNKITSKNAFQLQLIQRIDQVVSTFSGNDNAFQHAGCVVEAAAKIYDARVDETYKGTQRFIADLARSTNSNTGEEDALNAEEGGDQETAKAKRSKRLGVAKTLETNLNSINICKSDLECDVNPLFEKMSQKFDEGGARGLLLGNIPISDGPKIVIGGSATIQVDDEGETDSSTAASPSKPMMFSLQMDTSQFCQMSSTRKLCTDTSSFYNWYDMYAGQDNSNSGGGGASPTAGNDAVGNTDAPGMFDDDDDDDDFAGGDMFDDFGGDDMGEDFGLCDESNNNNNNNNNGGLAEDSGPNVSMPGGQSSAYSYYQMAAPAETSAKWANKKSNWAGQGHNKHWKLFDTPSSSSTSSGDGSSSSKKKKRAPKEIFRMDFAGAAPVDVKKAFATSRAATTISQKQWDLQCSNLKSYLLPDDAHYEMKDLQRLFFRPKAFVRAAKPQPGSSGDGDGDMGGGDDYGDDDDFGDNGDWGDENNMAFGEDNSSSVFVSSKEEDLDLVEDANMTEKIDIGYATTRKVFDIKQLKGEFWNHLSETAPHKPDCKELFENVEEDTEEDMDVKISEIFDGAATFSGTLDKVSPALTRLSLSGCFACGYLFHRFLTLCLFCQLFFVTAWRSIAKRCKYWCYVLLHVVSCQRTKFNFGWNKGFK